MCVCASCLEGTLFGLVKREIKRPPEAHFEVPLFDTHTHTHIDPNTHTHIHTHMFPWEAVLVTKQLQGLQAR